MRLERLIALFLKNILRTTHAPPKPRASVHELMVRAGQMEGAHPSLRAACGEGAEESGDTGDVDAGVDLGGLEFDVNVIGTREMSDESGKNYTVR